jgi:hypothetical protein
MAAQTLLNPADKPYKTLNVMGLLATNFLTIPDYIASKLKEMGHECDDTKKVILIERNQKVMKLVDEMQAELGDDLPFDLWMMETKLENIEKALSWNKVGRPVDHKKFIEKCYRECKSKINFFDYDLMCNWSKINVEQQLAAPTLRFAGDYAIIHVNGIKHLVRTHRDSADDEEVNEVIDELVGCLEGQYKVQFRSPVNTYQTTNRVTTTMGSVVLGIKRR